MSDLEGMWFVVSGLFPHRYRKCKNVTLLQGARPIYLSFYHHHNVCLSARGVPFSTAYIGLCYWKSLQKNGCFHFFFYLRPPAQNAHFTLSFSVTLSLSCHVPAAAPICVVFVFYAGSHWHGSDVSCYTLAVIWENKWMKGWLMTER